MLKENSSIQRSITFKQDLLLLFREPVDTEFSIWPYCKVNPRKHKSQLWLSEGRPGLVSGFGKTLLAWFFSVTTNEELIWLTQKFSKGNLSTLNGASFDNFLTRLWPGLTSGWYIKAVHYCSTRRGENRQNFCTHLSVQKLW